MSPTGGIVVVVFCGLLVWQTERTIRPEEGLRADLIFVNCISELRLPIVRSISLLFLGLITTHHSKHNQTIERKLQHKQNQQMGNKNTVLNFSKQKQNYQMENKKLYWIFKNKNKIIKWKTKNGLKFLKTKTKYIHFCNKSKLHNDPKL